MLHGALAALDGADIILQLGIGLAQLGQGALQLVGHLIQAFRQRPGLAGNAAGPAFLAEILPGDALCDLHRLADGLEQLPLDGDDQQQRREPDDDAGGDAVAGESHGDGEDRVQLGADFDVIPPAAAQQGELPFCIAARRLEHRLDDGPVDSPAQVLQVLLAGLDVGRDQLAIFPQDQDMEILP